MPPSPWCAGCSSPRRRRRGPNGSTFRCSEAPRTFRGKRILDQTLRRRHLHHTALRHRRARTLRFDPRNRGSRERPLTFKSQKSMISVGESNPLVDSMDFIGGACVPANINGWKQKIVAFAGGLGAPGLFLISFLDSSVLTFPVINDLLLIELSVQRPTRMPLYASMAALGSLLGCVLLFFLARKGGEALFHRRVGHRAHVIRHWVERNGFGGILVAAMLPPPTPFKFFVLAAGVFEVPLASFASAIALARAIRYFGVGYLAVRYGANALPYLMQHKLQVTMVVIVLVVASYAASRLILKAKEEVSATQK